MQNRLFFILILNPPVHYSENQSTDDLGSLNNLVGHFDCSQTIILFEACAPLNFRDILNNGKKFFSGKARIINSLVATF